MTRLRTVRKIDVRPRRVSTRTVSAKRREDRQHSCIQLTSPQAGWPGRDWSESHPQVVGRSQKAIVEVFETERESRRFALGAITRRQNPAVCPAVADDSFQAQSREEISCFDRGFAVERA